MYNIVNIAMALCVFARMEMNLEAINRYHIERVKVKTML